MASEKFEKIISFKSAYDKRHADPNKNYGISAVRFFFILKGSKGAISVVFSTDWYLPETITSYLKKGNEHCPAPLILRDKEKTGLQAWDVSYHSKKPLFENQDVTNSKCEWVGGACYSDGSCLRAEPFADVLIRKGSDAIWKIMEAEYLARFGK